MRIVKAALPVAVALAVVSAVTAVLWMVKLASGRTAAPGLLLFVADGADGGALWQPAGHAVRHRGDRYAPHYFLYDPLYSFSVANPLELGELFCFAGLALIGAKCTADLLQPAAEIFRAEIPRRQI